MADSRKPRRHAPFIAGLILILAALPLGWFAFLREPPPPPAPPPVVAPPKVERPVELRLSEVTGTVEVRQGQGAWVPARAGVALRPSDTVRTHDGSYAVLIGGEAVEVRMEPGTEVSVEELTDSLSHIQLGNGMATATVRSGKGHTIEVRAAGSDAVARSSEGTFTMSNDAAGTVAVGTRDGEVTFHGQGKVVIVRAGQQSIVRPGKAPTDPAPLPSSLLLKVQWPSTLTLRRRQLVVSGQTEPGSRVEVEGEAFSPGPDGRFTRTVNLREGTNAVGVKAVSVGGGQRHESREVIVDTTPPRMDVDPELWK